MTKISNEEPTEREGREQRDMFYTFNMKFQISNAPSTVLQIFLVKEDFTGKINWCSMILSSEDSEIDYSVVPRKKLLDLLLDGWSRL